MGVRGRNSIYTAPPVADPYQFKFKWGSIWAAPLIVTSSQPECLHWPLEKRGRATPAFPHPGYATNLLQSISFQLA